jgi:hypothetical protein
MTKTRKLKRPKGLKKLKRNSNRPQKIKKTSKKDSEDKPLKVKLKYPPKRCQYVLSDGRQCKRKATGKGTLCDLHGGDRTIPENMYSDKELISTNGALANVRIRFNPAVHPLKYIELARDGLSDVEIAAEFEISIGTLRDWSEKYESFNSAFEIGKAMHESWWIRTAKENLNERSFNTSLAKFLMMNKLGYSDKVEQKSMNMNMHGVLMVPDAMNEDEWENSCEEVIDV